MTVRPCNVSPIYMEGGVLRYSNAETLPTSMKETTFSPAKSAVNTANCTNSLGPWQPKQQTGSEVAAAAFCFQAVILWYFSYNLACSLTVIPASTAINNMPASCSAKHRVQPHCFTSEANAQ